MSDSAQRDVLVWVAFGLMFAGLGLAEPPGEAVDAYSDALAAVGTSATALTITSSPLAAGSVNVAYSQALAATGGTPPYTNWTVASGTLPLGISLNAAGILSGTPTKAGASTFKVKVTDSAGASATSASLSLTVTAALSISTSPTLVSGKVNVAYTQAFAATGGTPPYSGWTTSGSTLPAGLTLSLTGALTGIPNLAGTYSFTVGVTDKSGTFASASFQLTIAPGKLAIATSATLPAGQVNVVYSQTLAATGGTPPYSAWSIASGTVPPGLTMDSSGLLAGAPTTVGSYTFTVQVTDTAGGTASTAFKLTINNAPLQIATPSQLAVGQVGAVYSQTLTAMGGAPPYAKWLITGGALPAGLTLSLAGVLSGTPTNTGGYDFTLQVTDKAGASASAAFQLTVLQGALLIATQSPLPTGRVNISYLQSLAATGGRPPYTWAANSGVPGLSFSPSGVWSGTPSTAGTFSFTIQVADGSGTTLSAPFQLTISPNTPVAIATTSPLPAGNVNASYLFPMTANYGTLPYSSWTIISGSLPPGLTLSSNGSLSGTPNNTGTFSFTVQVIDGGGVSASAPFQLTINAAKLAITTTSPLPGAKVNTTYSETMAASGGTPPFTWGTNSTVPGLTLNSAGIWSGTPTATGVYSFTVQVADSAAVTASILYQLTVSSPELAITTSSLPSGQIGKPYSQSMAASGGTPPYTWTANSSVPGLSLSSSGAWSGTPTAPGNYSFTIEVTDSARASTSLLFQLTINSPAFVISTSSPLSAGKVSTAYSLSMAASGGTPPYTNWTISRGTPPAGLTLSPTGVWSGTPDTPGTSTFTVQVADKMGATASSPFQLTITAAQLTISTLSPLPVGKVNSSYSLSLAAGGGTAPYTNWTTSSGAMPPGLTLSSGGLLSGTPSVAGTYTFTVQVSDSGGVSASASLQLTIGPGVLSIVTFSPLPDGSINAAYSQTLSAGGGTPPYSNWIVSNGTLPPGLVLSSNGLLNGTATRAGNYSFTVQVRDTTGATASTPFQLTITATSLAITTASPLPVGKLNIIYALAMSAAGGSPPYTSWSTSSGTIPSGLTLSSGGIWSGTPTSAGTYNFTIQVSDNTGASAAALFQLTISSSPPTIVAAVNSASAVGGLPVTSGSWVALYGTNLAPAGDARLWNAATEIVDGKLPVSLDETSVTVNGKPATVEYISPGQVNIQMPDDPVIGPVPVVVTTAAGGSSSPYMVNYAAFSPGFFPASAPYVVAQHADNSYVTPASPAKTGEVIVLWGAGMGPSNPTVPAGQVFSGANPLANTVTVTIGGQPAKLDFAGIVGTGLVQINAHVPSGIPAGDHAVVASVGGINSPPGAYISVGTPATPAKLQVDVRESVSSTPLDTDPGRALVAPSRDPSTAMYAGTDRGVYKSSDGGANWQQVLASPGQLNLITSVVVDPMHPARIYAAGWNDAGEGIFFASLDEGGTWSKGGAPPATALAIDAVSTNLVYLLSAPDGEVYRSDDSGLTWSGMPMANGVTLATDPNLTGTVYVTTTQGEILRSADFGMTWTPIANILNLDALAAGRISAFAIDPNNGNDLYASLNTPCESAGRITLCGVYRNMDGGNSWQALGFDSDLRTRIWLPPLATHVIEESGRRTSIATTVYANPASRNVWYALPKWLGISGESNGFFRSINSGMSWDFLPVVPTAGQVFSLAISAK